MKKLLLTFLLGLAAFATFTANAYAIEVVAKENLKLDIYGEIYGDFFYNNSTGSFLTHDTFFYPKGSSSSNPLIVRTSDRHAFGSMALMGSSLLGFDLKFGKAEAIVEFGINEPVRIAILQYNFNSDDEHYLKIGKEKILSYYNFGQVSNDWQSLIGFGTLGDYRRVTLRYGIKGFHIGLIMPSAGDWYEDDGFSVIESDYAEITGNETIQTFRLVPGAEVAYTFANDIVDLKAFGSYRPYYATFENDLNAEESLLVHSASVGFGSDFMVGDGIIHFTVWYGLNQNLTGGLGQVFGNMFIKNETTGKISNNLQHAIGGAIGFEYTIAGFVTPGIGVGYTGAFSNSSPDIRHFIGAYINCKFDLGKYFSLIPEVAFQTAISGVKNAEGKLFESGNLITAGILGQVIF